MIGVLLLVAIAPSVLLMCTVIVSRVLIEPPDMCPNVVRVFCVDIVPSVEIMHCVLVGPPLMSVKAV